MKKIEQMLKIILACLFPLSLLAAAEAASVLPEGWEYAESLTSIDGAYINTGISQSNATRSVKMDCVLEVMKETPGKRRLMGFLGKVNNYFGVNGKNYFELGSMARYKVEVGTKYRLVSDQTVDGIYLNVYKYSLDDEEVFVGTIENHVNYAYNKTVCNIFAIGNWPCDDIKIYSFKLLIDDALVLDLRPVWNKSLESGGMFDLLTSKVFQNSGKGKFVVREEVSAIPSDLSEDHYEAPEKISAEISPSLLKAAPKKSDKAAEVIVRLSRRCRFFSMALILH